MSVFLWCALGPPNSIPQHAKPDGSGCPGVIGGADGLVCSCSCHLELEAETALQVRGKSGAAWDNGSHNKAAPAVRQHRDSGASPTMKESTDG